MRGEARFSFARESSRFEPSPSGVTVKANGQEQNFDYLVSGSSLLMCWGGMLPNEPAAAALAASLDKFTTSPITGIHLWFDRQISDLDHAVLLDRTIQWMFHKSRLIGARSGEARENGGSYIELVVSCSRSLVEKSKAEIVEMALKEVAGVFPRHA